MISSDPSPPGNRHLMLLIKQTLKCIGQMADFRFAPNPPFTGYAAFRAGPFDAGLCSIGNWLICPHRKPLQSPLEGLKECFSATRKSVTYSAPNFCFGITHRPWPPPRCWIKNFGLACRNCWTSSSRDAPFNADSNVATSSCEILSHQTKNSFNGSFRRASVSLFSTFRIRTVGSYET